MKCESSAGGPQPTPAPEYESPRVETVLTADEVEREAHYGGGVSTG